MMGFRQFVLDTWAYLNYKSTFGSHETPNTGAWATPGWMPPQEKRRLHAYMLYESYYRICAREWLAAGMEDADRTKRREYGDSFLLVETALSSLMGNEVGFLVDGAVREKTSDLATKQQLFLEDWSDKENFNLKMWECERNSVKLGDGVYVVGWDDKKKRPRISVYDPGMFFPDLEELHLSSEDFPQTVNICYEFTKKNSSGDDESFVRRIQWGLRDTAPYRPVYEKEDVDRTCIYSDGYWHIDGMGTDPLTFDESKAIWITAPVDLKMDFIPVFHIPCFDAGQEFYSIPVTAQVMQLLDDVAANDTDIQAASAVSGNPAVALSGASMPASDGNTIQTYGPGQLLEVGDGTATVIDTSNGLKVLGEAQDKLLSRLSINSRTPEALLGRVKPNEVPSGITLTLGFTQHSNMIRQMRMVRDNKYSLMFRAIMRLCKIHGTWEDEITETKIVFGSYLPSDMEQAMEQVVQGLNSHAMSTETAVTLLIKAGFPIEDAVSEVKRIQSRDFDSAVKIVDATQDINLARTYIGAPPVTSEEFLESPGNELKAPIEEPVGELPPG